MKFSIVVPIYNIEPYLECCVLSLINQDYDDYEIILVDDGSKDNCPTICDRFASKCNKVRVIHKENGGLVSARNSGVAVAKGEYIGYVDGDDWVEPNLLSKIASYLEENEVDVVNFNFYNNIDGNDEKEPQCDFSGYFNRERLEQEVYPSLICNLKASFFHFGVIPAVWCKFYNAELLKQNLCTNLNISFGEDVACSYFCLLGAQSVLFIKDYLYHYRRNRTSMTKSYSTKMFHNSNQLLVYMDQKLVITEYQMQKQYEEYRRFVLFKCILNEARAQAPVKEKAKRLEEKLRVFDWMPYIDRMNVTQYPIAYKVFFGLVKSKQYSLLMLLSSILLRIHG